MVIVNNIGLITGLGRQNVKRVCCIVHKATGTESDKSEEQRKSG